MKAIQVSKEQKQETDYIIEVINGFFGKFVTYTDSSKIYMQWKLDARLGDIITYMCQAIRERP